MDCECDCEDCCFVASDGPQGWQGPDASSVGAQGPQGEQGFQSETLFPQGMRGFQGDAGFDVAGEPGTQGFDATLLRGVQGDEGWQGDAMRGLEGHQGNRGPQGFANSVERGPQGIATPEGVQGTMGIQGPLSHPGALGPKGFQGARLAWLNYIIASLETQGPTIGTSSTLGTFPCPTWDSFFTYSCMVSGPQGIQGTFDVWQGTHVPANTLSSQPWEFPMSFSPNDQIPFAVNVPISLFTNSAPVVVGFYSNPSGTFINTETATASFVQNATWIH